MADFAFFSNLLGLVFTDIVASTEIGRKLGDAKWIDQLFAHFSNGREIASRFDSYVVKVIGDSLMVAFRTASDAVGFAIEFAEHTGVSHIGIRVGINSGDVEIRANDIYGLNVNFTSRVLGARDVDLKSFGTRTLYFVSTAGLVRAIKNQRDARSYILELVD